MKPILTFELDGSHVRDERGAPLHQAQAECLLHAQDLAHIVGAVSVVLDDLARAHCAAGSHGVAAVLADLGDEFDLIVDRAWCADLAERAANECVAAFRRLDAGEVDAVNRIDRIAYEAIGRMAPSAPATERALSVVGPDDEGDGQ